MGKGFAAAVAALLFIQGEVAAQPVCERAQDAVAVRAAALQQEFVVAAYMCHDVWSYNHFVLTHRAELQQSDRVLMSFFRARSGEEDYDLYKTELANTASLRSKRDPWFCGRAQANFRATEGRPLAELLAVLPYPVDTGGVQCDVSYQTDAPIVLKPPKRKRHHARVVNNVDDEQH